MTNTETIPTAEEADAMLAALELHMAREADYQADLAKTTNSLDAYWAGSACASVVRDYRAGRVVTVKAGK